jgi:phosphatidate cytidylyltransferase
MLILAPILWGFLPGSIILGILVAFTSLEFLQLLGINGKALIYQTIFSVIVYSGLVFMIYQNGITWQIQFTILLGVLFGLLLIIRLIKNQFPFAFLFRIIPTILYVSIPLFLLISIAVWSGTYEPLRIIGILLFIWTNDILAYFIGKTFGRHAFSPSISPKKTWEGTIGGWVGCILVGFLTYPYIGYFSLWEWIVLGLIIGILGSTGDLIESLFKRKINIKDSGTLLPGHGGFLDRMDALLFTMPFIALFFLLFA